MITGLFRTERGRRALLGLSLTAAFVVACGSDDSSNPFLSSGGSAGSSGSAGAGQGGTAVGASGSGGLGGAGVSGGAGTAGEPSMGGASGAESTGGTSGASGGASNGGSGGTSAGGASGGTGGTSAGTGGAGTGGAGTSGSGGAVAIGGSGGAIAGSGGAAGEPGAAGDGGAAGAADDCGGHGCPAPTIINTTHPNGLALDGTYVYWTTVGPTGTVQRAPIAGGAAQPIATSEPDAFDLAVAGGNAFWLLNDTTVGEVVEASVAGANRLQLTTGDVTGFYPAISNVSSDGTSVYFVADFNDIAKIPAGGVTARSTALPLPFISQGPYNSNIVDMVLFGGQLYYTNNGTFNSTYTAKLANSAAIRSVDPTAGNGSVTLVSQLNFPLFQIAVDSAHIFWNDDQNIYSTGLIGGVATPLIAVTPVPDGTTLPFPTSPVPDMVSDGVNLYYADAHTVYRVPVTGGMRHTISSNWTSIQRLAVDANNLYFTDFGGGAVVEIAK
jgi:hypothetical protein